MSRNKKFWSYRPTMALISKKSKKGIVRQEITPENRVKQQEEGKASVSGVVGAQSGQWHDAIERRPVRSLIYLPLFALSHFKVHLKAPPRY